MWANNTVDFTTAPPNFVFNASVNIVSKAKILVTEYCSSAMGLATVYKSADPIRFSISLHCRLMTSEKRLNSEI
jgi:hypothetical protein